MRGMSKGMGFESPAITNTRNGRSGKSTHVGWENVVIKLLKGNITFITKVSWFESKFLDKY